MNHAPCWYYEKSDLKLTPSFKDGIPHETEKRYRYDGPKFIMAMGKKLGLHYDTIATGVVYFHRFYMFHSFKKVSRHVAATCCLFLAGKVEETPKKLRHLIATAKSLLQEAQFKQFSENPREELLTMEKMLLHTIRFDFFLEHPYKFILEYAGALKGDRSQIESLVQMSWNFVNDSLSTNLCLLWEPQIIAVAVMFLAGRLCKFQPQDWAYHGGRWWEQFIPDITIDLLEDICHQILDQYSKAKPGKQQAKSKREHPKTPGEESEASSVNKISRQTSKQKASSKSDNKSEETPDQIAQIQTIIGQKESSQNSTNEVGDVENLEISQPISTIGTSIPNQPFPTPPMMPYNGMMSNPTNCYTLQPTTTINGVAPNNIYPTFPSIPPPAETPYTFSTLFRHPPPALPPPNFSTPPPNLPPVLMQPSTPQMYLPPAPQPPFPFYNQAGVKRDNQFPWQQQPPL